MTLNLPGGFDPGFDPDGGMSFGPSSDSALSGFNFMFSLFPYLFVIVFILVIGGVLFRGARYVKNASSPRQSVFVKVAAKRTQVEHHSSASTPNDSISNTSSHSHTYYYITLEYPNGERVEYLDVKGLYGLVAEGDTGYAAVQGDWIVAFERTAPSFYS